MKNDLYNGIKVRKKIEQSYEVDYPIYSQKEAIDFIVDTFHDLDREAFITVHLDKDSNPIDFALNHLGTINRSVVSPREVFKSALLSGADSMILMHNHPSGSTVFSEADYRTTEALETLGKAIGIEVVNHYVFTPQKEIVQIKDIESNVEQTRFNFSLDNPNKFNSIGVRQIIFNDDLFKIDSPDSVSEFTSENLNENYSSHMLFLNNQNQVVSMLGDIDKTQIKNPLLIEKILRQAILSNSARMLFINEKADKQLPDINDFIPLMETSALFEVPLLDIVSLSTYGMESLRQNDPYTFEDILNIQEENNEYKLESREPEMKDKTIQMNLFDYFMDSEEFTIKQATELVKDQRNINVNNESIRARIYEGVDSGLFTRVSRGVYKVESQLQDKTVSCLLINGNGRDLSSIADESIDSIITDHPYDLTKSLTGGNRKFATYELFKYQEQDFKEKNRVLKEGAFCVEFLPEENEVNFEYLYNLKQMAIQQGFKYFAKVPWTKGDFVANTGRKSKNAEDVMIFSKGEPRALKLNAKKNYAEARENGLDITGLSSEQVKDLLQQNNLVVHYMKGTSGMLPKSFDYQPRSRKDKVMEAEKPVELLEDIIEYVTLPFEVVLDQFAGSGNLAIASANKNRSSILIEKDETMFNKMKENIEENIFTDEALNVIIEDLELIGLSDVIATHKISLGKLEELSKTNPVLKKELTTAKSLDKLDHKGLVKIPENNNQSIENNKIKR